MAVEPFFFETSNCYAKVNGFAGISANYIKSVNRNSLFSSNYIFDDSIKKIKTPENDSLIIDSNFLPRGPSAIKTKVKYFAKDSIVYSTRQKTASLYSNAKIEYEDLNIKSARIIINLANNSVNAIGELDSSGKKINTPNFKQGSSEYNIEEATFNYETKRGIMKEFKTQEGEGYIKGEKVKRDENNSFYIRDATYSTCSEENPHFYIFSSKLKFIPGKRVITGPANLFIADIRTPLIVPFGIFPLKTGQQSGLIIPAYGNAPGRGYFLRQGGYYLGLGEHLDIAVLGDIFANLSWQLGGKSNYSYRYRYAGYFSANYALNKNGLPEDKNFSKTTTFNIVWSHYRDPKAKPGSTFRADVNLVGNQYLAQNTYVNNNTAFNNNINSSISYGRGFRKGKVNLSLNARASQNTHTRDASFTLPDLTLTVASFQPLKPKYKPTAEKWYEKITMNYTGQFQNLINTKDTLLFKSRSSKDLKSYLDSVMRNGARHSTSINNSFNLFKFYTVYVRADYSENWAFKTIRKEWDTAQKIITEHNVSEFGRTYQYSFSGGVSTRFYGMLNFKRGRLKAIRHVINPNAGFTYVPDFSKPSYGFYTKVQKDVQGNMMEYSINEKSMFGGPSRGRQGNINFSIDNNLEIKWKKGKDTAERIEKMKIFESLNASGYYNIYADSMKLSMINLSGHTTLLKVISVSAGATLDPYKNILITDLVTGSKSYIRINKFYLDEQLKLGIITRANAGFSASLNPEMFKRKDRTKADALKNEMKKMGFSEFKLPWTLSLSYTVSYDYLSKINPANQQLIQTLGFNGSITPSPNWFVNFNSGYDFRLKKISHLGIDLRRDIHCWQFTFAWTPLSAYDYQYFIFNINVKSTVLQDLKTTKRKDWFDKRN